MQQGGREAPSCDTYRPCVECVHFHQYWRHFDSAYQCERECHKFQFNELEVGRLTFVIDIDEVHNIK